MISMRNTTPGSNIRRVSCISINIRCLPSGRRAAGIGKPGYAVRRRKTAVRIVRWVPLGKGKGARRRNYIGNLHLPR
jgi:hypothetical protein